MLNIAQSRSSDFFQKSLARARNDADSDLESDYEL